MDRWLVGAMARQSDGLKAEGLSKTLRSIDLLTPLLTKTNLKQPITTKASTTTAKAKAATTTKTAVVVAK